MEKLDIKVAGKTQASYPNVTLQDLIHGVVAVSAPNGFPLATSPRQGGVEVEFGTGRKLVITANEHEYEGAKNVVESRAKVTQATTPAKAFKHYLQIAHNVVVDEATAGAILAVAKSA